MSDIDIRTEGRAGRITLNRPKALNALTHDMVLAIDAALKDWRNADIDLLIIDGIGEKAFCAGGDIAQMYATGTDGDYSYGRTFWVDEYRMNARMAEFPKPVVTFLQGYTMGGGVGVGCHGSHRIVCDSSRIAMPECGIGLVPDVGGSMLLANAPGRLGEFLAITATRMHAEGAILCGFADYFVPETEWDQLKAQLCETGDWEAVDRAATPVAEADAPLAAMRADIDRHFGGERLGDIIRSLKLEDTEFTARCLEKIAANSPLSMACAIEMIHRLRDRTDLRRALELEYRFSHRAMQQGDFIEGIRAAIIDKDRNPKWRHSLEDVNNADVVKMLMPLGAEQLTFEEDHP